MTLRFDNAPAPVKQSTGSLSSPHQLALALFDRQRSFFEASVEDLRSLVMHIDDGGEIEDPFPLIRACTEAGLIVKACLLLSHRADVSPEWLAFFRAEPQLPKEALADQEMCAAVRDAGLLEVLIAWNAAAYIDGLLLQQLTRNMRRMVGHAKQEALAAKAAVATDLVGHVEQETLAMNAAAASDPVAIATHPMNTAHMLAIADLAMMLLERILLDDKKLALATSDGHFCVTDLIRKITTLKNEVRWLDRTRRLACMVDVDEFRAHITNPHIQALFEQLRMDVEGVTTANGQN